MATALVAAQTAWPMVPNAAQAQTESYYTGTNSEGAGIYVRVAAGSAGGWVLTEISDGGAGLCSDSVTKVVFNTGIAPNQAFSGSKVRVNALGTIGYVGATMSFGGATVSGILTADLPAFAASKSRRRRRWYATPRRTVSLQYMSAQQQMRQRWVRRCRCARSSPDRVVKRPHVPLRKLHHPCGGFARRQSARLLG